MKQILLCIAVVGCLFAVGCDVQSVITKKSVEKYEPTPTPVKTVEVVEQLDPDDVVTVDTTLDGPKLSIIPGETKTNVDCTKYNRVSLNADGESVQAKGICKQIMVNGDKNQITAAAVTEIVFNGSNNSLTYTKYANGKKPVVKDNRSGNTVEKVAATPAK